ncbi:efflux RND transporter periplasmic adaptor subunit [Rhizobium halophytocola]|uniref:RND family efflux transporter MFP subunit n=1 Tax=Rhizobium halophytocola TaxID=735519 RepID=A0ABS4DUV9_9HYPH|nr:efflux RND transporter periplasmic adaptor subunit [Rhizobium halophytocola]MBP1849473.1 RND family efflux transporter MFP subunit [Rhizobium halophytocola]
MQNSLSGNTKRRLPAGAVRAAALAFFPAFLLALGSCSKDADDGQPSRKTALVARPQTASVTRYFQETGTAQAVSTVSLVARVSGTLKSIDYKDGTEVKAGQRLFLIEPEQYQAEVEKAEASVAEAQANVDNSERQMQRQDQLSKSSATAESNVDDAKTTLATSKAQLASAKAALTQARLNLGYTSVTAPFDGFVTAHQADVGALVGADSGTLATIIKLDPIHVSFSISDGDMLTLRKRARANGRTAKDLRTIPVEIGTQIDKGYPTKGHLDYAAPQTAADTGTLAARAVFENADRALLPGLFVRIRIPVEKVDDALLVPPASIGTDQQGRYVLAVDDKGMVARHAITVLDRQGEMQEVEGDVSASDLVLQNVLAGPQPGDTVEPKEVVPPTSSSADLSQADAPSVAGN